MPFDAYWLLTSGIEYARRKYVMASKPRRDGDLLGGIGTEAHVASNPHNHRRTRHMKKNVLP